MVVDAVGVLAGVGMIVGVSSATHRGFTNGEMLLLGAGAVAPYLLGAPIAHLTAGNGSSALQSAGWRLFPVAVGFALTLVSCQPKGEGNDNGDGYDGGCLIGGGAGVILGVTGMAVMIVVDPVYLAKKSVRPSTTTIVPAVTVVADRVTLSVGGAF